MADEEAAAADEEAAAADGRGVCARGNYVREMPGWDVEVVHDGIGGDEPHTVRTTTPTGHTYTSRAGPWGTTHSPGSGRRTGVG